MASNEVFPGMTPWDGVEASARSKIPCNEYEGGEVSKADWAPVCNLHEWGRRNFMVPPEGGQAGVSAGETAGS